jgi:mannobiose 2-epimerase
MVRTAALPDWAQCIEQELVGNILPFWVRHTVDGVNGGFYGAVTPDLRILNHVPRSAVLCARILWTFAAAYRTFQDVGYWWMAQRAYDYLRQRFWDHRYGGVYWSLDYRGNPVNDRKHVYAQAFAIYGLSEYYRATQEAESLKLARELFQLIEEHSFDAVNQGNIECCSREWGALSDMRLSEHEPDCRKSMNSLLHLMEAYTNLMRVWNCEELEAKQSGLIRAFLRHVIDPQTWHLRLFFDDQWNSITDQISFGHDIEASWLLVEAAQVRGELEMLAQVRATAVRMAEAVYAEGLDADGSVLYEAQGPASADKHWWVQAEAVVGFYNAYQLSSQEHFAHAARRCWSYIEDKLVDRTHGDWFKRLSRAGIPYADHFKVGPWECPYHHSRACFEMMARLSSRDS